MIWLAVGFLVHQVWLRISVSDTLPLFLSAMGFVGPPTLTAGLLALRATRPVLVSLVPIVLVWLITALVMAAVFDAVGITIDAGISLRAYVLGLAATVLGTALADLADSPRTPEGLAGPPDWLAARWVLHSDASPASAWRAGW